MNAIAEPLAALWERTRAKFARAVAAIGDAARIAALRTMSSEQRRAIVRWIHALESIVRKLLLAEAQRLAAPQERKPPQAAHVLLSARSAAKTPPRATRSARAIPQLDRARPETWPVRFSLALPRDPLAVPERRAPSIRALWGPPPPPLRPPPPARRAQTEQDTSLRLALRFEAVRRVLQHPAPHVQRLAQLLRRLSRRFPEIVQRYALSPCAPDRDEADPRLRVDLFTRVLGRKLAFGDTS